MEVLRLWQSQQWSSNYSGEVNKPIMNVELMMVTDQVLLPSGLYEIQQYLIINKKMYLSLLQGLFSNGAVHCPI